MRLVLFVRLPSLNEVGIVDATQLQVDNDLVPGGGEGSEGNILRVSNGSEAEDGGIRTTEIDIAVVRPTLNESSRFHQFPTEGGEQT